MLKVQDNYAKIAIIKYIIIKNMKEPIRKQVVNKEDLNKDELKELIKAHPNNRNTLFVRGEDQSDFPEELIDMIIKMKDSLSDYKIMIEEEGKIFSYQRVSWLLMDEKGKTLSFSINLDKSKTRVENAINVDDFYVIRISKLDYRTSLIDDEK
jgi:hypothetical protein